MPESSFSYILRYKIDPAFHAEQRIEELARFCAEARIDQVMLFFLGEELSTGHATLEELRPYVRMGKRLKERLAKQGVGLSLNPWTTIYHSARGRRLRPGQDFTLMVGETGFASPIAPCPLCPNWQAYICETFSYLAGELQPVAIWVEDDFRLHNHETAQGWGGCFCSRHLQLFAEKVGREATRPELLKNILAPGQPHPWRKIWLDICRESLLQPAAKLYQAVHKACPSVRLGLMSSSPDVHSIEHRDWSALQNALGTKPAFLSRPHLPPYTESPALSTPPADTRLTIANLAGPLEIYPELESSPRCGPYSKSGTYCLWECQTSAVLGSRGITINHFDMMGNGISAHPGFGAFLADGKPRLAALAKLELDDRQAQGVRVLFSPQVAAHRHSTDNSSMHGLRNMTHVWGEILQMLGIAHGFSKEITADGTPYVVNDQTLRAFDDRAIEKLLSAPVILDAFSVEVLLERGFGGHIGIASAKWTTPDENIFAYESIIEEDPAVFGLANPRMTAQRCADRVLVMQPNSQALIRSWICSPGHQRLFPGAVSFTNPAGGRVLSLTYPLRGHGEFKMAFFNCFRRTVLQNLLLEMAPRAPLAMAEEHPLHLYRAPSAQGTLLAAFNVIQDWARRLVLRVPPGQLDGGRMQMLDAAGRWQPVQPQRRSLTPGDQIIINADIAPLDGLFLLCPPCPSKRP